MDLCVFDDLAVELGLHAVVEIVEILKEQLAYICELDIVVVVDNLDGVISWTPQFSTIWQGVNLKQLLDVNREQR